MNIILLFTYGYSLKTWHDSGSLDRELLFYKKLKEEFGVDTTFVTYGDSNDETYLKDFRVVPIYKFVKKRKSTLLNYLISFYYPFIIKKNIPDISIIKQNQLLGSWVAIILKLILNKPLFVRTGYDMYKFSKNDNKSKLLQILYKLLTKFTLLFSDLYSVSSSSDFNFLKKQFGSNIESKIIIRPNWVVIEKTNNLDNRKLNNLLNVGRLENQKNQKEIIESLSNTDLSLTIYGEGTLKSDLINKAKHRNVILQIFDSVSFLELKEIYSNHTFFILSSHYEGNPKVLLEAMASGCIVVAKNIDNNKEIIDDKINGFLYNNKEDLTILIRKLISGSVDLESVSKSAVKKMMLNNSLGFLANKEFADLKELGH